MNVGTAAFLVIVLFTVHEFEEIIRIRPWIVRHINDPRFVRDTFISRRHAYPSTEVIAVMIGEEILLASLILTIAVAFHALPVVLALATGNSVHLVGHLVLAARVRAWNPGSITAAITLPLNVTLVAWALIHEPRFAWWLAGTFTFGAFFAANLIALHRLAPELQRRVQPVA